MKARVTHLHRTEAEWSRLLDWKPEAGELVIYDPDEKFNYARIKIGDGHNTLAALPFFVQETAKDLLNTQRYSEVIDGGNITDYID